MTIYQSDVMCVYGCLGVVGGMIIKSFGKLSYNRGSVCFQYCCRVVSMDFIHRCQHGVILCCQAYL